MLSNARIPSTTVLKEDEVVNLEKEGQENDHPQELHHQTEVSPEMLKQSQTLP